MTKAPSFRYNYCISLEEIRKLRKHQDGTNVYQAETRKQKLPNMKQKWCPLKVPSRVTIHCHTYWL